MLGEYILGIISAYTNLRIGIDELLGHPASHQCWNRMERTPLSHMRYPEEYWSKALGNTGFSSGSAAFIGFQVNPSVNICKVLSI